MTCKDLRQTCDRLAIEEFNIISTIFQHHYNNLSTNISTNNSTSLQQTFRQTFQHHYNNLSTDLRQTCDRLVKEQFNRLATNLVKERFDRLATTFRQTFNRLGKDFEK